MTFLETLGIMDNNKVHYFECSHKYWKYFVVDNMNKRIWYTNEEPEKSKPLDDRIKETQETR